MAALLIQHPSARVKFDAPPPTAESIRTAWEDANAQRALINAKAGLNLPMHPPPANLKGFSDPREQDVVSDDRATDRCLADGAVLINNICVQCGRDNS